MSFLLDVEVRHKAFGADTVLKNVALHLHGGEVVALVGASGCGKSTLLRIVAGLDRDFVGHVRLDGETIVGPVRAIRCVFQEPRLFPWLTVASNVAFDHGRQGAQSERVNALLAEVGLAGLGERLPKQLSGGQAQRAAIARGLFVQPRLLLLDEPFSAVDAFTRLKLQDLLLNVIREHGISVLMVTHDIDEAVHLADRVLVLEAKPGHIAADIPVALSPRGVRDHPASLMHVTRVRQALRAVHAF